MYFRRHPKDADDERGRWAILDSNEAVAAIVSLFVVVAGTFVIILVDSWLGIGLIAVACVLYFVLSALHIGASRRRVAAQLDDFEQAKRNRGS